MSRSTAPAAVRWTAYVAVAIVFAVACAFLSNWQFTRNADRAQQLALVEQNYDAEPVAFGEIIDRNGSLAAGDEWRPVTLEGEYLATEQVLVRNRPHGGTAAFEVLVPFRMADGRVLLVDRGWVPPGEEQPLPDEIPAPPDGRASVLVRLRAAEQPPASGRSAPDGQVPTLSPPLVAEVIDPEVAEDLELSAYGVLVSEDPAPATRPNALSAPSEDPGPHLSYAIQWILFAIMGFVFIGYVIRTERRHRREDAEDARQGGDAPPRVRTPARRNDRDMQDEDSILDAAGR
ncbi:SURF1 family protein [Microbacterium sp.]|uniref:SURF1 family cytochrome oxidase biogenesis protein n=1 Tax=Microbacterium sp. TaxID=51671 RepID=UPI002E381B5C|nr:SURF1 family protein [Microbacterium sp.]HEX5729811.1 SURF1 family protein [Microbacterium sp.]